MTDEQRLKVLERLYKRAIVDEHNYHPSIAYYAQMVLMVIQSYRNYILRRAGE